jgi:cysteine-rich repeat protein
MTTMRALPWTSVLGVVAGLALGSGPACIVGGRFACSDDAACREGDVQGTCESVGYCSFADATCESGARFTKFAPAGLARTCTDVDAATTSLPAESSAGDTTTESSSTTAMPDDIGGSSTGPLPQPVCGDGMMEGDEACDDGNLLDADGCNGDCVVSGTPLWTVIENGPAGFDDYAYAVALLPSGDIVATGRSAGDAGDVWMARFDPETGANLRSWQYGNTFADEGRAIATDASSWIYVVGTVGTENAAANIFVRAYYDELLDGGVPGGNVQLQWPNSITSGMDADDLGFATAIRDTHGEIVVAGSLGRVADPDHPDAHVRGFPLTGEDARWTCSVGIDALANDVRATVVDDAGRVFVGGSVRTATGNPRTDAWIGEIDLQVGTGTVGYAWTLRLGELANVDVVHAIAMKDGELLVAGHLDERGFFGTWTTEGVETSRVVDPGPDASEIHGIAADPTGAVVTVGYRTTIAGMRDVEVIKYAPDGDVLWTDHVDGESHEDDRARAVVIADDGSVIVAGHVRAPASDSDIWLRKYAP